MQEPTFDILSGAPGKNARWLEAVPGFANARKRMETLAADSPGPYFIFNPWNSSVPVQINTQAKLISAFKPRAANAA